MNGWERVARRDLTALRGMSIKRSIAIGEALLTSDVMRIIKPVKGPRPPSLAMAIGILRRRSRRK